MRLRPRFSLRTLFVLVMIIGGVAVASFSFRQTTDVATLNSLRDEINASYGFKDGTPRINCGHETQSQSECMGHSVISRSGISWSTQSEYIGRQFPFRHNAMPTIKKVTVRQLDRNVAAHWNARFPAKVQFACLLMPPIAFRCEK